jgi:hypothetical protein
MNPAPDADLHSVGPKNFEWIVQQVADLAVKKAKKAPASPVLQAQALLGASVKAVSKAKAVKTPSKAKVKGKTTKHVESSR